MNRRTLYSSWQCALAMLGILALPAYSVTTSKVIASDIGSRATSANANKGDKTTVWVGVYTQVQAKRGQEMYQRRCASCHQEDLQGDGVCAPPLVGQAFWSRWSDSSVGAMYEKIRTTMPGDAPGVFSPQEYADVVSYLLNANKLPAGQTELPPDQARLNQIVIQESAAQQ